MVFSQGKGRILGDRGAICWTTAEITARMTGQLADVSTAKAANAPLGLFSGFLSLWPAFYLGDEVNFNSDKPTALGADQKVSDLSARANSLRSGPICSTL
jgi:hypothetical protein